MKYGDRFEQTLVNRITGQKWCNVTATYKLATWNGFHTDDEGDGLWNVDKQIVGTCDFTVRGCQTEKAAKAKIRNYVNSLY